MTVQGAVRRPGRYELTSTRDLSELLELGGGLATTSTHQLPLRVQSRSANDQPSERSLPFLPQGRLPTVELHNDDVVWFPSVVEVERSIELVGAIAGAVSTDETNQQRRVLFVEGESARTLLERVGGVAQGADLRAAFLHRQSGELVPVDLEALLVRRDFTTESTRRDG